MPETVPKTATRITVRLPIAEKEVIQAVADRRGVPMSDVIREAVRDRLREEIEVREAKLQDREES